MRIKSYYYFMFLGIILFITNETVLYADEGENAAKYVALSDQIKTEIQMIANDKPVFMQALIPEMINGGTTISLASISAPVIDHAVKWINNIMKKDWVPGSIENIILARKELKTFEKRDINGIVFSSIVGDYLIADYIIQDYHIFIQENGLSISVRIDLPHPMDISEGAVVFVKEHLLKFLNLSKEDFSTLSLDFHRTGNIVHGSVKRQSVSQTIYGTTIDSPNYWWHKITLMTNGSFIFISVPERDGKPCIPRSNPGLPKRF